MTEALSLYFMVVTIRLPRLNLQDCPDMGICPLILKIFYLKATHITALIPLAHASHTAKSNFKRMG